MDKYELYKMILDMNIHKPPEYSLEKFLYCQMIGRASKVNYATYVQTHIGIIKINYN